MNRIANFFKGDEALMHTLGNETHTSSPAGNMGYEWVRLNGYKFD